MSEEKKTIVQVVERCRQEGLTYAITDYISSHTIADPELAKLWKDAERAIEAVELFITSKVGDDWAWG